MTRAASHHAVALALLAALAACGGREAVTGAALYAAHCASCHGPDARGGSGPVEGRTPPDLTGLAARNRGRFPATRVMSTIDGYARDATHGAMPAFGALIDGPVVIWVDETGVPTPTPEALVLLGDYLRGLQEG